MSTPDSCRKLPGFKKIEFVVAEQAIIIQTGDRVELSAELQEIPISDIFGVTIETRREKGVVLQELKTTCDAFNILGDLMREALSNKNLIFVLTDIYNERYLVGGIEKPHPVVEVKFISPETTASGRRNQIDITYRNEAALLPIVS